MTDSRFIDGVCADIVSFPFQQELLAAKGLPLSDGDDLDYPACLRGLATDSAWLNILEIVFNYTRSLARVGREEVSHVSGRACER